MGKYLEQQYEERDYALELAKKHNLLPEDNSNMTWEELREEAKKMGGKVYNQPDLIFFKIPYSVNRGVESLCLEKNGDVRIVYEEKGCVGSMILSQNRTPDQMFAIMKALQ